MLTLHQRGCAQLAHKQHQWAAHAHLPVHAAGGLEPIGTFDVGWKSIGAWIGRSGHGVGHVFGEGAKVVLRMSQECSPEYVTREVASNGHVCKAQT